MRTGTALHPHKRPYPKLIKHIQPGKLLNQRIERLVAYLLCRARPQRPPTCLCLLSRTAERKTRRWRRRGVRSKNYEEARTSYRQWRLAIKPILWADVTNDYACTPLPAARPWFDEPYNAHEPCHPYLLSRQNRFCSNAPSARLTIFSVLRAAKKPTIQV